MNYFEALKSMTVLLAEDDEIVRDSTTNVLEAFAGKVVAVSDGAAALDVFSNTDIDIVILDIGLPTLNGIEVARTIRRNDSQTPIFIVTSFSDTRHLQDAIPLMLVEYLIKPLTFDQIKNALIKSVEYIDKQEGLSYRIDNETAYHRLSGTIIYASGEGIVLPNREKQLLDLLIKSKNKLVSKTFLENTIFDLECNESSLKNLVYRLKKKLPAASIVNVRDFGYMFTTNPQ